MTQSTQSTRLRDYLIKHASRTVWCSPYEDMSYILELKQLTGLNGATSEVELFDRYIRLPDSIGHYHVYMVGGNFPEDFGLPPTTDQWYSLTDYCNTHDFSMKVYNEQGVLIPTQLIHYFLEYDGTIYFAIEHDDVFDVKLGVEPIFIQFRNNKYWVNDTKTPRDKRIFVMGKNIKRSDSRNSIELEYNARDNARMTSDDPSRNWLTRVPLSFYNGRPVIGFNKVKEKKGDYFEVRDDGSTLFECWYNIAQLPFYQSELDKCNKYLVQLYYPQSSNPLIQPDSIHYRDDLEIYLIKVDRPINLTNDGFGQQIKLDMKQQVISTGCYYHRNNENSVRMVTHQSYGLPVEYVQGYIQHLDPTMNLDRWYLRVLVKGSGLNRNLIHEVNGLKYFNLLPYHQKIEVLTGGTDSPTQMWSASNLEKSIYNYLMRCLHHEITPERVLNAYGYNGTAMALMNPNVSITKDPNGDYFIMPVGLINRATVYEYDRTGKLLGFYHHINNTRYLPVHSETIFIEAYSGLGNSKPNILHNPKTLPLDPDVNYRVYQIKLKEGVPIGNFMDVTDDTTIVVKDQSDIKLKYNPKLVNVIAVGDDRFLSRTVKLDRLKDYNGVVDFTMIYGENNDHLYIPFENISIWVNGRAMIEDIDYYIEFPKVVIVNKQIFKDEGDSFDVTYRCHGFPGRDMVRMKSKETGFIVNGEMSLDGNYDIHEGRISRINIGGGIYDPRVFQWNSQTGTTRVPFKEGTPYTIENQYVSLSGLGQAVDTFALREKDRQYRKIMSDYLNVSLPAQVVPERTVIQDTYPVYSPFLTSIVKSILDNPKMWEQVNWHSKSEVNRVIEPFKWLLKFDPAYLGYDQDFIHVDPIPWNMEDENGEIVPIIVHHRVFGLLEKITKDFLKYPVDINRWFRVTRTRKDK